MRCIEVSDSGVKFRLTLASVQIEFSRATWPIPFKCPIPDEIVQDGRTNDAIGK